MSTAILGLDTSDPASQKAHKVSESTGDVLYFSGPGVLAVGGSSGSPLANLHTTILGLPPGGTAASDGDLITSDSGLSIDLYVGDFSYAGGPKRLLSEIDSFGGDLSGAYSNITTKQVECPNSENWPSKNSRISFGIDEIANELYINVQYSDGSQYYSVLLLQSAAPL